MIVNQTADGWELFYQRAHALLAGQIAAYWREDERPARWFETLAAITQHDDHGREWERETHLTPAGAPQHFRLGATDGVGQPREVVNNARYQGRYVALLMSLHMSFLYEPMRGRNDEITAFLDEQHAHQDAWRAALGVPEDEIARGYAIMAWADALSLILCQRELPVAGRAVEIMTRADGTRWDARQLPAETPDDGSAVGSRSIALTVEPWPFAVEAFAVEAEAQYIDQLAFASDDAFLEALRAARIEPVRWAFRRQA